MGNPICELCSDIEQVKELLKESEAHIKSVNAYEWAVRYDMVAAAIKSVKNHLTEALATDSSSDQPMGPQGGQSPQGAASSGKVQQGRTEHALLEDMPGKVHAEQKEHHGEPRCRLKMKRD